MDYKQAGPDVGKGVATDAPTSAQHRKHGNSRMILGGKGGGGGNQGGGGGGGGGAGAGWGGGGGGPLLPRGGGGGDRGWVGRGGVVGGGGGLVGTGKGQRGGGGGVPSNGGNGGCGGGGGGWGGGGEGGNKHVRGEKGRVVHKWVLTKTWVWVDFFFPHNMGLFFLPPTFVSFFHFPFSVFHFFPCRWTGTWTRQQAFLTT